MRVVTAADVPPQRLDEGDASGVELREIFTEATGAPTFAMRLFEVAPGAVTLRHAHPWEHEVYVLDGRGELVGEDGPRAFAAGDCCYTAPNELHQFRNTGAVPLRFLCMIPHRPSAPPTGASEGLDAPTGAGLDGTQCSLGEWRLRGGAREGARDDDATLSRR